MPRLNISPDDAQQALQIVKMAAGPFCANALAEALRFVNPRVAACIRPVASLNCIRLDDGRFILPDALPMASVVGGEA